MMVDRVECWRAAQNRAHNLHRNDGPAQKRPKLHRNARGAPNGGYCFVTLVTSGAMFCPIDDERIAQPPRPEITSVTKH